MNREALSRIEAVKRNMNFMDITKNVYELEKLHGKSVNCLFVIASMNVYNEDELEKMHSELHECYRKNLRRL